MLGKVIVAEFILFLIGFISFKGFGYVAIIMLLIIVSFFVIMDVLKYVFGIDPVKTDRDAQRKKHQMKNKKKQNKSKGPTVAYRFHYVN
jgi:hypothetical protein